PGDAITPVGTNDTPRQIAEEIETGEDQDDGPELAGTNRALWSVRTLRQQWEDDDGEDGEVERRAQLGLADAAYEFADPALLGKRETSDGRYARGDTLVPQPRQAARGEHKQRGGFRGAIPVMGLLGRHDIGGYAQDGRPADQSQGQEPMILG